MKLRNLITVLTTVIMLLISSVGALTASAEVKVRAASTVDVGENEQILEAMPAKAIAVAECTTGELLFAKNCENVMPISHLAKLMTLLIAAQMLESKELSLDDIVTVSDNANSQEGAQIWLDKGEKIRLEELIKAITIGNANDACTAVAEHISGNEEEFVKLMNSEARRLGMTSTVFADCTGMSEETVSTAENMTRLAAELLKYEQLRDYLTCWMDTVREGKAELVSQNRLIRTYKGITGMKACASQSAGECSVVTAEKRNMKIAVVILGCDLDSNREDIAKKLLDLSFESFSLYTPEITKDMLKAVPVTGGETDKVGVSFGRLKPVIIPKGSSYSFDITFDKQESAAAPVKKGAELGSLECTLGGEVMYSAKLTATGSVEKMNFKCGFKKLMYNLLEFDW